MSPTCDGCGAFVSHDFQRVAGANDGTVVECINCGEQTGIAEGPAAGLGGEHR